MATPDQNGVTTREHLEQVERQIGRTPVELIGPEYPVHMSRLWSAFLSLSSRRPQGFNGPLPLGYDTIKYFIELTDTRLDPWEISVIEALDRAYMRVVNE